MEYEIQLRKELFFHKQMSVDKFINYLHEMIAHKIPSRIFINFTKFFREKVGVKFIGAKKMGDYGYLMIDGKYVFVKKFIPQNYGFKISSVHFGTCEFVFN